MPSLHYLDDSPCFPKDRRLAEAFVKGGVSAEREMREEIRAEEDAKRSQSLEDFNAMVKRAKEKALINPPPQHDAMRFRACSKGDTLSLQDIVGFKLYWAILQKLSKYFNQTTISSSHFNMDLASAISA